MNQTTQHNVDKIIALPACLVLRCYCSEMSHGSLNDAIDMKIPEIKWHFKNLKFRNQPISTKL